MMGQGYIQTSSDHCMFLKRLSSDDFIVLLLYVNVMLIIAKENSKLGRLKVELAKYFSIKDLGPTTKIL